MTRSNVVCSVAKKSPTSGSKVKVYLDEHLPVSCKVALGTCEYHTHNTMVRVSIIKHEHVISTLVATVLPVCTGYHVQWLLPKHECIVYDIGRGGASYLCPASCCSHNTNAFALIR